MLLYFRKFHLFDWNLLNKMIMYEEKTLILFGIVMLLNVRLDVLVIPHLQTKMWENVNKIINNENENVILAVLDVDLDPWK